MFGWQNSYKRDDINPLNQVRQIVSVCAGLQVSMCSSYDLCQSG